MMLRRNFYWSEFRSRIF